MVQNIVVMVFMGLFCVQEIQAIEKNSNKPVKKRKPYNSPRPHRSLHYRRLTPQECYYDNCQAHPWRIAQMGAEFCHPKPWRFTQSAGGIVYPVSGSKQKRIRISRRNKRL